MYQPGDTLAWAITVRNGSGTLVDLDTPPTAAVTLPDGTTASAVVTRTGTGTYQASLVSTQLGRYVVIWTGTGPNSGGFPHTDHADVLDAVRMIIPLSIARAALNLAATSTVNDDELRLYIAAATTIVEHLAGPVLPVTQTETRSGRGRPAIALNQRPSVVTSVTVDGTAVTDWCVDEHAILWRGSRPGAATWPAGTANVVVAYTVGSARIDPAVMLASRELLAHLWRSQVATRPVMGSTSPEATMVAGYLVPNRVIEGLAAHRAATALPGIA